MRGNIVKILKLRIRFYKRDTYITVIREETSCGIGGTRVMALLVGRDVIRCLKNSSHRICLQKEKLNSSYVCFKKSERGYYYGEIHVELPNKSLYLD